MTAPQKKRLLARFVEAALRSGKGGEEAFSEAWKAVARFEYYTDQYFKPKDPKP